MSDSGAQKPSCSPHPNGDGSVRFFENEAERDVYRCSLKERPCPHCATVGFVICHGFLSGYGAGGLPLTRGYRFLCSNRRRKRGCGRTYSVLLARVLPRRHTPAALLGRFLALTLARETIRQAWRELGAPLSLSTFARLRRAFADRTVEIRRRLAQLAEPPCADTFTDNDRLTIAHLQHAFQGHACPVCAYQRHFQQPFVP